MIGKLNDQEIDLFLKKQFIGRIGCVDNEKVYIVPVTYAFDDDYIYGHTRPGKKIELMRANPNVCFQVEHIVDMEHWESVIVWGTYEELRGKAVEDAMQILMNHTYGKEKSHWFDIGLYDAITYRIKITEKTGRFEKRR